MRSRGHLFAQRDHNNGTRGGTVAPSRLASSFVRIKRNGGFRRNKTTLFCLTTGRRETQTHYFP